MIVSAYGLVTRSCPQSHLAMTGGQTSTRKLRPSILKFIPGKTTRQRVAGSVAILAAAAGILWWMINAPAYGSEGEGNPPQLWTSGLFQKSTIFTVLYACMAVTACSVVLFQYFKFSDNLHTKNQETKHPS